MKYLLSQFNDIDGRLSLCFIIISHLSAQDPEFYISIIIQTLNRLLHHFRLSFRFFIPIFHLFHLIIFLVAILDKILYANWLEVILLHVNRQVYLSIG
jgi:hypothetical protein